MRTLKTIEVLFADSEKEFKLRRGWGIVAINVLYKNEECPRLGNVSGVRTFANFKKVGLKLRIVEDLGQQSVNVNFAFFKDGDSFEGLWRAVMGEYTQECEEVLFYK